MADWQAVLEEVVRERHPALVGYACLFTTNRPAAEDLVQDALVRTFSRPRALTDRHTAEGFVREVIRTTFLDQLRRKRTWTSRAHLFVQPEAADDTPDRSAAAAVDVQSALNALPARERACVVLRYFDDLPVADIAQALGISAGSVKRYLSDGTAKLRLSLDVTVRLDEPGTTSVAVHPVSRAGRSQS
ncbi:SigE family RNA polymerase sigma factor [Cellulomonas sp. 179-A 4D5 NHS]|uniref:SigE family RNA polymerase sigma factor n=1 Tax=Cellulomonas sp. 179-A 4D5 NHS TaxID=3142378 RepID=UPI00399F31C1